MDNKPGRNQHLSISCKYISIFLIGFLFLSLTSCEKSKLTGANKVSVLDGRANDGDAGNGGEKTYTGSGAGMAIDNATIAISGTATYNTLTGNAISVPGPNAGDGSYAISNNKVTSTFQPAEAGDYQFEFKPVIDIKLINGGKGEIQLGGKVQKANGEYLSGSAFQRTYKFELNNNNVDIELSGSGLSTSKTFSKLNDSNIVGDAADNTGPNVNLKVEQYTIVFEMNIQAISPFTEAGQPRPEAHISATTTFDLK